MKSLNFLRFRGFEPNQTMRIYASYVIQQIFHQVLTIARIEAEITSTVVRHGARYVCTIELKSRSLLLKATAFAVNPVLALDKARRKLSSDLLEKAEKSYGLTRSAPKPA